MKIHSTKKRCFGFCGVTLANYAGNRRVRLYLREVNHVSARTQIHAENRAAQPQGEEQQQPQNMKPHHEGRPLAGRFSFKEASPDSHEYVMHLQSRENDER